MGSVYIWVIAPLLWWLWRFLGRLAPDARMQYRRWFVIAAAGLLVVVAGYAWLGGGGWPRQRLVWTVFFLAPFLAYQVALRRQVDWLDEIGFGIAFALASVIVWL